MKREEIWGITESTAVGDYKRVLQRVLDVRPAGTRGRLAEAIGKNRSFVSQITSPNYRVPIPARHLGTVFKICHFSPIEREEFLEAYRRAHPLRPPKGRAITRWRAVTLRVPQLHDDTKNKAIDNLLHETAHRLTRMIEDLHSVRLKR
jgi:hypothetical protein